MSRKAWIALLLAGALGCAGNAKMAKRAEDQRPLEPAQLLERRGLEADALGEPIELVDLPPEDKRQEVPGFDGATAWLNVDHALTTEELRGRVVVVDFWTSCCINCLHTIPTLQKLEARFRGQPLVVIGVHSPKFDEEREADRLRDIVRDNRIEHPIALDGAMAIWNAWGVEAWPTVAVLDIRGRVLWATSGEPDERDLTSVVASAMAEGRRQGALAKGDLRGLRLEKETSGALRYPGKVTALADGGLAIADTGHHRVILVDKSGAVEAVIGSGLEGRVDSGYAEASFRRPQGITEAGSDLYVADTGNHMLRKIDRKARRVSSVAGTGELGYRPIGPEQELARSFALRSPWDVLHHKGTIYVALAGSHQIAAFEPEKGTIRGFAGSGHEARRDGDRWSAAFAQPSALATDGKELFVLDSETSSVRAIDLAGGEVRTLVGLDLFVFGDKDGDRMTARLEHPVGMAYGGGALWVADTYNSKLKRVDPKTGATRTALGAGTLSEPAGITVSGSAAFVADTNNHRIVRYALAGGAAPSPVTLASLTAPTPGVSLAAAPSGESRDRINPADPVASLGKVRVGPGKPARVRVGWQLPPGTGVNEEAPFKLVWTEMQGLARLPDALRAKGSDVQSGFDVTLEPLPGAASGSLRGVLDLVVCDVATHRVCVPVRRTVEASFSVEQAAADPARASSIALPPAN